MISMARPFLADPDFVRKAMDNRAADINTCIACNQACLDHIFSGKTCSCLVNPFACHETRFTVQPAVQKKRFAVVGAGPAGMAFSATAAERGHAVTLFDSANEIGGQFNLARKIPGKEEFAETLRYFSGRLKRAGVDVKLGQRVDAAQLSGGGFDLAVLATGISPRTPEIPGIAHAKVIRYADLISGRVQAGTRVAVIGAGGIGFDVAEFLTHRDEGDDPIAAYQHTWGIDPTFAQAGGLSAPTAVSSPRTVFLLQRKTSKVGDGLAKTTGWSKRLLLQKRGVQMIPGVSYEKIDDAGLHIRVGDEAKVLDVDTIILCAGQEPLRELQPALEAAGLPVSLIGGADVATELDAKRAIEQGTRLALAV
jgi:2,4-dienoyl-CoA reductase (NADPH2)